MSGLYTAENWMQIVLVTGVIGGGAAVLAGRAISSTWRPYWYVIAYMLLLSAGVRFLHFALFQGELLSLPSYLVDTLYVMAVSSVSYRVTLVRQMTRQYPWLYEQAGPFGWRERHPQA
jgi:hypothetical protein